MFGVGTAELVVIALAAVLLFPPTELPKLLRSVSKFWGQLRATADEFKDAIMTADGVDELQDLVKGTKDQIHRVEGDARRELMKARAEMRKAQQTLVKTARARDEIRKRDLDDPGDAGPDAATPPDAHGPDVAAPEASSPGAKAVPAEPSPVAPSASRAGRADVEEGAA